MLHSIPSANDTRNRQCHQTNVAVSATLWHCRLAHLLHCSNTLQLEPNGMLFHCFYVNCSALVLCFSRCSAALCSSTLRSPALFLSFALLLFRRPLRERSSPRHPCPTFRVSQRTVLMTMSQHQSPCASLSPFAITDSIDAKTTLELAFCTSDLHHCHSCLLPRSPVLLASFTAVDVVDHRTSLGDDVALVTAALVTRTVEACPTPAFLLVSKAL